MTGSVSITVGKAQYTFHVEGRDDLATLNQMIVMGNPPTYCKELPKGFYNLETNKDKEGNVYVNMACAGKDESGVFRIYKAKLGSYKDKSGFFWHNFKLDEYQKSGAVPTSGAVSTPVTPTVENDEDIPF